LKGYLLVLNIKLSKSLEWVASYWALVEALKRILRFNFYIGHTDGDPPPMIPRYEFLTSLREKSPEEASSAVIDLVERLVDAIDAAKLAYDRDHNFLSSNTLVQVGENNPPGLG
jgi:hypothetical protein